MVKRKLSFVLLAAAFSLGASGADKPQKPDMTFFVTSVGMGKGADLGGLAGADKHCQQLASAVGAGKHKWHAYLSTQASGNAKPVDARDRIGKGPWRNAKGVVIAKDVYELHSDANLTKQTALNEKGEEVKGRGDKPNVHDALTGSEGTGTHIEGPGDTTCSNWTSSADTGSAMLGHIDRQGIREDIAQKSWNSAHPSAGCSQQKLVQTGGAGLFYCFAVK